MKRKQTEIQVRLRSKLPFILLGKSNKNYFLSLYKIENNALSCKTTSRTYYNKNTPKDVVFNNLVLDFIKKIEYLKIEEFLNLRILKRKITSRFWGKGIISKLLENKIKINQNIIK